MNCYHDPYPEVTGNRESTISKAHVVNRCMLPAATTAPYASLRKDPAFKAVNLEL
jgi:hypothetical protein